MKKVEGGRNEIVRRAEEEEEINKERYIHV